MTDPAYIEAVCKEAPVDLYNAAYLVKCDYPYRVEELENSSPTVAEKASKYLLDSKIGDDSVTNTDVLDRAAYLGADAVIPKDYLAEQTDDAVVETAKSLEEFLVTYADHEYDGDFTIPLQFDAKFSHIDSYEMSIELLDQYGYDHDRIFMLGGIKDVSPMTQFEAAVALRRHVGEDVHLHGLGMGTSLRWARVFREYPDVLDSIDNTTAMHRARAGRVYDASFDYYSLNVPRGTKSSTLTSYLLEFNLLLYNYMMSDLPRESDTDALFEDVDISDYEHAYTNGTTAPLVADTTPSER